MAEPSPKARALAQQMTDAVKAYFARGFVANVAPLKARVEALEARLAKLERRNK